MILSALVTFEEPQAGFLWCPQHLGPLEMRAFGVAGDPTEVPRVSVGMAGLDGLATNLIGLRRFNSGHLPSISGPEGVDLQGMDPETVIINLDAQREASHQLADDLFMRLTDQGEPNSRMIEVAAGDQFTIFHFGIAIGKEIDAKGDRLYQQHLYLARCVPANWRTTHSLLPLNQGGTIKGVVGYIHGEEERPDNVPPDFVLYRLKRTTTQ